MGSGKKPSIDAMKWESQLLCGFDKVDKSKSNVFIPLNSVSFLQ